MEFIKEEGVIIKKYGDKISKKLNVFYNPKMKLNRDISLVFSKTFFEQFHKKFIYCDPMIASGIREIRFLKTMPEIFDKLVLGDLSKDAISDAKDNFKRNNLKTDKVTFLQQDAINTLNSQFFNYINLDPFGSIIPFLDVALRRIKHESVLSVTTTDLATLCGHYPNSLFRKYFIKGKRMFWYEEFGLRNFIAYCQRISAKYDKSLTPLISYSSDHYYRVIFFVEENKTKALEDLKKLSYFKWDRNTQFVKLLEFGEKESYGKTYVGKLNDKDFLKKMLDNTNIIKDNKRIIKLLNTLIDEIDLVGYYVPSKFEKNFKFQSTKKFSEIFENLKRAGYKFSRCHNNNLGIKTDCPFDKFLEILNNN